MTVITGSALHWGPLWGARARDWAGIEEQQVPTYEAAIDRIDMHPGLRVLEIGCGSGVFLRLAADRGAGVSGIDASEELIELARERVPEADVRVGDMEALPYPDDTFDIVAGFNSFFFATDMVNALRDAGRVARPGAPVIVQVWGDPDRCDLTTVKNALRPFLPNRDEPSGPGLWEPGVLEGMVSAAGLAPAETFAVSWAYTYSDADHLIRAMLSPGLFVPAVEQHGAEAIGAAIVAALAPYRTGAGSYSISNEWHFVIARA
jgi:SAM-dependent methyltransferase